MGRFSKLEPTQPGERPEDANHPTLHTRLEPGAVGDGSGDDAVERPAGEWLAMGEQAFLRGDFKPALRLFSRALDKDTTQIAGWVSMVRVLLFQSELGQAETWVNRALTLFPSAGQLLAMRAVVYGRRGMLQQALNNSDAVLSQHASDPVAQVARGEVLLLADNKNAEFCFSQALSLVPANDWQTPSTIGMIYEERRMWARAVQYYTIAAERNEGCAALWFRVASCRAELGQKQHARTALLRAEELCAEGDPLLVKINHAETGSIWKRLASVFKRK